MKTDPNAPINVVDGMYASDAMSSDKTGLTKREHFAGLAMQGYVSENTDGVSKQAMAEWCVAMADALINALNK